MRKGEGRRARWVAAALCVVASTVSGPAAAGMGAVSDPRGPGDVAAADATDRMALLATSADLADIATRLRDPVLLAAAARMRVSAGFGAATDAEADRWLDEARRLAAGDPLIERLVSDVRDLRTRGRMPGPVTIVRRMRSGETLSHEITFKAGVPAIVYVEGRPGAALSLLITPRGQSASACRDDARSRRALCRWLPTRSIEHRIDVTTTVEGPVLLVTN